MKIRFWCFLTFLSLTLVLASGVQAGDPGGETKGDLNDPELIGEEFAEQTEIEKVLFTRASSTSPFARRATATS